MCVMKLGAIFLSPLILVLLGCSDDASNQKSILSARTAFAPFGNPKISAYRIDSRQDKPEKMEDGYLYSWKVIATKEIRSKGLSDSIRNILTQSATYGNEHFKCFLPGMAFSLVEGDNSIEILICLKCRNAHYYKDGSSHSFCQLSAVGVDQLARLYQEIFPDNKTDVSKYLR